MTDVDDDDKQHPCPKCGTECQLGYGLAGGGIGAYLFCPKCEEVVEKWQDPELE